MILYIDRAGCNGHPSHDSSRQASSTDIRSVQVDTCIRVCGGCTSFKGQQLYTAGFICQCQRGMSNLNEQS